MSDLCQLRSILGPVGLVLDPKALDAAGTDWRGLFSGPVLAIARPATVAEVAQTVRWAAAQQPPVALVPQGGNTSLAGGAVPQSSGPPALILSSTRLNRVRSLDKTDGTITLEAGVVLQAAKDTANPRVVPVDLAARGSAQIGGLLASHAGGLNVVRYGNLRSNVLGLEAVLPDGRIYAGLTAVTKDNSGYDLKSLLIGSEGTLGFITAATLRLAPPIAERSVFLIGVQSPNAALALYRTMNDAFYGQILAAELLPREGVERGLRAGHIRTNPFPDPLQPWLFLLEITHRHTLLDAEIDLAFSLLQGYEHTLLAQSAAQAARLWQVREGMQSAQGVFGASIKHDVAVPIAAVPELIARGMARAQEVVPGCAPLPFGHLGDGSLHFNISAPDGMTEPNFRAYTHALNQAIHDIVHDLGGSISAEHGVGQYRCAEAARLRNPTATQVMAQIKQTLDPLNIFNPGKVISQ